MILQDLMICLITFMLMIQLYLSSETSLPEDLSTCKSGIEDCIKEIHLWMLENKLNFLCTIVFHIHFPALAYFSE